MLVSGNDGVGGYAINLMLGSKAEWVEVNALIQDKCFYAHPDESLAEWHGRLGLEQ